MKIRSTHLTLTSVAASVVLIAGSTAVAVPGNAHDGDGGATLEVKSMLRDLHPSAVDPTDGARSKLKMSIDDDGEAEFRLVLKGIDPSAAGRRFGAHLHFGPCVAGDGAAALGHYNTDVVAGVSPTRTSPDTEVWLDFTVTRWGTAKVETSVPFAPRAGIRSIVIHQDPTNDHTGAAGARLACLPVAW